MLILYKLNSCLDSFMSFIKPSFEKSEFFIFILIIDSNEKLVTTLIDYIICRPLFEELAGKGSIWGKLSSSMQEVALNVDSEFEKLFISKIKKSSDLIPPSY